jgi:hypothetical protein
MSWPAGPIIQIAGSAALIRSSRPRTKEEDLHATEVVGILVCADGL